LLAREFPFKFLVETRESALAADDFRLSVADAAESMMLLITDAIVHCVWSHGITIQSVCQNIFADSRGG
jgi:hypothetical protein